MRRISLNRLMKRTIYPTKHHDLARVRGGQEGANLYRLTNKKHEAYHVLFGNRTFAEAAEVLQRLEDIHNHKRRKR